MAESVRVEGLKDLRKALKSAEDPKTWGRELGRANRVGARQVASWAQSTARGMGGPYAHFAGAIAGRATQVAARVEVRPEANATFWGAYRRTGWNAGHGGRPQHPKWVGASWTPGVSGEGPYAINETIARRAVQIDGIYAEVIARILKQAFPDA